MLGRIYAPLARNVARAAKSSSPLPFVGFVCFSISTERESRNSKHLALSFVSEHTYIPCPGKKNPEGEDAHFITKYAVGVADGVGGYAEVGIDSGAYARALMSSAGEYCLDAQLDATVEEGVRIDPMGALVYAYQSAKVEGGSTAVIATTGTDGKLVVRNLGDSGLMVWRHSRSTSLAPPIPLKISEAEKLWAVALKTEEQTHYFNCPYQLPSDSPDASQPYTFDVLPGDIVLVATDGLFDNLFVDDMKKELAKHDMSAVHDFARVRRRRYNELRVSPNGKPVLEDFKILGVSEEATSDAELKSKENNARAVLKSITASLAIAAHKVGADTSCVSPFSKAAPRAWNFRGGKQDDVMVIAALVVPDDTV